MALRTIGYFKLVADSEHTCMIGAMLVVDEMGKPEEYRVTHPVKPTMIQRQIYGGSLFGYVAVELCGLPLFDSLKNKPELLIVNQRELLAMDKAISLPVVYMDRAAMTEAVSNHNGTHPKDETLRSQGDRFKPVRVLFLGNCPEETRRQTTALLGDFFEEIDLLEPMNRIDVSVETLQKQDAKFR